MAVAVACSCKDSTSPTSQLAGIYALQTINGQPLPFLLESAPSTIQVTAGTITLGSDGSFTGLTSFKVTTGGNPGSTTTPTDTDAGTWTHSGSSVTVNVTSGSDSGMTFTGGVSDTDTFATVLPPSTVSPGEVLVYKKK